MQSKKLKRKSVVNLDNLLSFLLVIVVTVTCSLAGGAQAWAITGNQTIITGEPKILFYEVPADFVKGENIETPKNVTFTLNANRDVVWKSQVSVGTKEPGQEEVTIDPITGIVHVPLNTYSQTISVTAISNDGTGVTKTFQIKVTDEVKTIENVVFDWETAKTQAVDEKGRSLLAVNGDQITVSGKVDRICLPYTVTPSYINNKNVTVEIENNNNIRFSSSSYVYNYDEKMRLDGDPDGYVTMTTVPEGVFNTSSQVDSIARIRVLSQTGTSTKEVGAFYPKVENKNLHFFVTNDKTKDMIDSADVKVTDYKKIDLNQNNEFSLSMYLADDVSWYDSDAKSVVDYANTLNTMTFYYWTGEIKNNASMKELKINDVLGNLGYENDNATKPTVDADYVNEYQKGENPIDPFQRKLLLSRVSKDTLSIKTPLAVPNVEGVDEVKNVWICARMTPKDKDGNTVGSKTIDVLYCLVLNLDKEEPDSVELNFDQMRADGFVKAETQKLNGEDKTVYCVAGNIDPAEGDNGTDTRLMFGYPILDKKEYVNLNEYYEVSWQYREAATLEGLERNKFENMSYDELDGRHYINIGNNLGYREVKLEITATQLGQKYGLGEKRLEVSYYLEIIPNVKNITLSNELELSKGNVDVGNGKTVSLADTEDVLVHAYIGQTLHPDCIVDQYYQTYQHSFGGHSPTESKISDFRSEAEPYAKKGYIKFHSLDESIASVDSMGTITAKKPGTTYVLAYSEPSIYKEADNKFMTELGFDMTKYVCSGIGTISDSGSSIFRYNKAKYIKVVVNEDQIKFNSIGIDSTSARADHDKYISINTDNKLEVVGRLSFTLGVTTDPVDAAPPKVIWSSSDPSIARVNGETGEVTTLRAGLVTITATLSLNSSNIDYPFPESPASPITASQDIVVKSVNVTKLSDLVVDASAEGAADVSGMTGSGTVEEGKSFKLKYTQEPENATADTELTWDSSDKTVATVDNNGVVKALKVGTTVIRVSVSSNPAIFTEYTLTVKEKTVIDNPSTNPPSSIKGDVTGEGTIDLDDVMLALKAALGIEELDEAAEAAADFNDDGSVGLDDVLEILRKALGIS